jgi:hypothetical protein
VQWLAGDADDDSDDSDDAPDAKAAFVASVENKFTTVEVKLRLPLLTVRRVANPSSAPACTSG